MTVLLLFEIVISIVFLSTVYGFSTSSTPLNLVTEVDSEPRQSSNLLILGLGRVGSEVAKQALLESKLIDTVVGTVRNYNDDIINTKYTNINYIPFDIESIRLWAKSCNYIFVTIPANPNDNSNDDDNDQQRLDNIFRLIVEDLEPNCWIGIISTTGVYGDHDGAIVNEDSECNATSSALRYIEYEQEWISLASNHCHKITILRCAGIYSNDQSALHTVYKKGLPSTNSAIKSVTNRIHVVDIGRAVIASMKQHHSTKVHNNDLSTYKSNYRIYNLADNHPENRDVVFEYAANLLKGIGVPIAVLPTSSTQMDQTDAPFSSGRASRRLTDRKIVSNQRMLQELLPESGLIFPTYKEGLTSILNDPTNPWWTDSKRI